VEGRDLSCHFVRVSGHNRWSKIKHKKAASDAGRSKIWSKVIKELTVAARMGGGDAAGNPRLRTAIDKARGANMPNDTIDRAIKKGTGDLEGVSYEEITYEGYGPGGVALMIEVLTDNRTRAVAEVRNVLAKHGGNFGAAGSVAHIFKKRGTIVVEKSTIAEDKLMELALEAGAEDVRDAGEIFEVETDPAHYLTVKEALEKARVAIAHGEIGLVPSTRVPVEDEDKAKSLLKLIAAIEDNDDVQNVYGNHEIPDALMEKLG
jgi:YebC/PmpR family DNA-binding regulatory protein